MKKQLKNIGFKEFESKPITRTAIEITEQMSVKATCEPNKYSVEIKGFSVKFVAYEAPCVGDYIVHLSVDDVYHVGRSVFHDRNVVERD